MKELPMLVWLTQLGLSVAAPLVVFILLAVWLRTQFGFGLWVIWTALVLGILCAVGGLRQTLRMMEQMDRKNSKPQTPPVPGYNEHT